MFVAPDTTVEGNVQVTVGLARLMPGFFRLPAENVVAFRTDGTLIGPANLIDGVTTVPARSGFAGLTATGLYQINVTIPANLADGDYPVTAEVGGVRTLKFAKLSTARISTASAAQSLLNRAEKQQCASLIHRIRADGTNVAAQAKG